MIWDDFWVVDGFMGIWWCGKGLWKVYGGLDGVWNGGGRVEWLRQGWEVTGIGGLLRTEGGRRDGGCGKMCLWLKNMKNE